MELIILTGMSGAGKSQAAAYFEDKGYFCIDNLPPQFLPQLTGTLLSGENGISTIDKVCFVVDIRSRSLLDGLVPALKKIDEDYGCPYQIVFLEASDDVLVSRYRQTRRSHPLTDEMSLIDAIKAERKMLQGIRGRATNIIDTTMTTNAGLKKALRKIKSSTDKGLSIYVESFGFMYGMPTDSDDVLDVRFLPNPFWVDELKMMSGLDEPIAEYLEGFEETSDFLNKISELFNFMLPLYVREGKSRLSIGVGCTGGRHRSVYIAETLGKIFTELGYSTIVNHRDIDRDSRYVVKEDKPAK